MDIMWANPWGGSWPIHQSAYQNVPHDQVDWASLAKQWIAQREAVETLQTETLSQPPPPPPPPPPAEDSAPPSESQSQATTITSQEDENSMDISDGEDGTGSSTSGFSRQAPLLPTPVGPGSQGGDWGSSWVAPTQGDWKGDNSQDSFDFSQDSNFNDKSQFNYPSGGDVFFQGASGSMGNNFQQFWPPQGGPPHPPMGTDGFPPQMPFPPVTAVPHPPRHGGRERFPTAPFAPGRHDDSALDSAKRRHLPAWIREGLEKMEREKQRQAEKDRLEHERVVVQRAREQADRDAADEMKREREDSASGEARVPRKSRFDSDDEDEKEEADDKSPAKDRSASVSPAVKKRSPSPEQFKSEEEKQMELMLKVKRWMTEILLEVTNEEIEKVVQGVYSKARVHALKGRSMFVLLSSTWLCSTHWICGNRCCLGLIPTHGLT